MSRRILRAGRSLLAGLAAAGRTVFGGLRDLYAWLVTSRRYRALASVQWTHRIVSPEDDKPFEIHRGVYLFMEDGRGRRKVRNTGTLYGLSVPYWNLYCVPWREGIIDLGDIPGLDHVARHVPPPRRPRPGKPHLRIVE